MRLAVFHVMLLNAAVILNATAGEEVAAGAILVKGAWSSASDSATAMPEGGKQLDAVYRNDYFGLVYSGFGGWINASKGRRPAIAVPMCWRSWSPPIPHRIQIAAIS